MLRCLAFTPDGEAIAAAGKGQVIHLWDISTGQEILGLEGHKAVINALAFSPRRLHARIMQPRRRRPPLARQPDRSAGQTVILRCDGCSAPCQPHPRASNMERSRFAEEDLGPG